MTKPTLASNEKLILDAVKSEAEEFLAAHESTVNLTESSTPNGSGLISNKPSFPVLSDKALFGLAGEIVRVIEPQTEASTAALLVQLLSGFGNLIGKTAHFKVGADYHYMKIFTVLVGATASGRKGTSWSEIQRFLVRTDESFQDCIQHGLSSGEGLIYHVRDPEFKMKSVKSNGTTSFETVMIDEGATDKRAFVIESEFGRLLKVISRHGNTLSPVIRQAWDTDRLQVMTKNPIKATEAHISIVGHVTKDELISNLQQTETANGFANRILWFCVEQSKYLPDGGNLTKAEIDRLVIKLKDSATFAKKTGELKRDDAAAELWHKEYKRLSDGYPGILGAITSRATAQVMRLACLYALLDQSEIIKLNHLEASLALWKYSEDSAKYIFGMQLGDRFADTILNAINNKNSGLDRTNVNRLFNGNAPSDKIENAVQYLLDSELIEETKEKTNGRPRTILKARR